jgi:hypothetical protein
MPWCRFRLAWLFGLLGMALVSRAQSSSPLHSFFQQHFDSTLVYQSSSNWNTSPNYLILAKHQNQFAFFTYSSPYRDVLGHYFPGKLVQKFGKEESRFRATIPDTNRYLLPQRIAEETLRHSWQNLISPQLWAIQGDEQGRSATGGCMIEDGEEITLYLIDKKAIRAARFYAPTFYEACVGKDPSRQQVIQLSNTLPRLLQSVR